VIGVIANTSDEAIVREFFELFKTPWEFYVHGRSYDVVLCAGDPEKTGKIEAKVLLIYSSEEMRFDARHGIHPRGHMRNGEISCAGFRIPLYANAITFDSADRAQTSAGCAVGAGAPRFIRLGYDLFDEIRILLTQGQPRANATIPVLDLHVALLRRLITGSGVSLVEVPPVPAGFSFIACLTHDLDHPSIRRHVFDSTIAGFLYRATIWSLARTLQGRLKPSSLLKNWSAAMRLPFVYLGWAEDFWYQFDRYLDLERGRPCTFFAIPFEGKAGRNGPSVRASGYGVAHIAEKIRALREAGCEIGLHGIDAWADTGEARKEAKQVVQASGASIQGVRMHWLYSDEKTPAILEESGFSYDSTVGYNDRVGYKAGTTQVFKPLQAKLLLELPLHVMDTAMFYPDYMNLTEEQAWARVTSFMENASCMGGALTINWHDRSIAPERLWGEFYERLLTALTERNALFLTASQAVSWFAKRRSIVFEEIGFHGGFRARVGDEDADAGPEFRLRVHHAQSISQTMGEFERVQDSYTDTAFARSSSLQGALDDTVIQLKVAGDGYR
jgi:hypothetical protein